MATYRELHGKAVKTVTTNPTDTAAEGQIWFNSTDNQFRSALISEAWSAGTSTATSKQRSGGCGTQTAGLNCGGFAAPPNGAAHDGTEEYNGSGWSTGGTLNTARGNTKLVGTQTAGVFFGQGGGGQPQSGVTEEYNGTAWTTVNPMANAINYRSGCGIESALLATGGNVPGTNRTDLNEEYDGTNWSTGGALPQRQSSQGQAGTQTAAINSFGYTNSPVPSSGGDAFNTISLEYDGSSWTAGPSGISVAELTGYAMGSGTQTDAIFAGAPTTNSCKYDGTTFTVGPALAIAQDSASHGSTSASDTWIAKGSPVPSVGNRVQDFNRSVNIFTAAAWSSGGNLNLGRHDGGNAGTKAAGLFFGGKVYPNVFKNESEEYDGTSWSEGNNLGTARMTSGAGTQTAGLAFGGTNGAPGSTGVQALTEEYDGSSWSESGDLSTARMNCGGAGLQTAAYAAGGIGSPNAINDLHEQYNGSTWSTSTAMNTARSNMGSVGTTTASLVFSGYTPPSYTFATTSEEWNGSSWTSGGTVLTARYGLGGFGSQTDAIGFAGATPPNNNSAVTEGYDGSTFSTRPSMSTARMQFAPSGSYNSGSDGMAVGGSNAGNPMYANTEEWSTETTELNVKTLTQS
tara:strand:+ start:202 stop:2085 length:1884 start_codon:yes stop_codon:yes gene_type:complete